MTCFLSAPCVPGALQCAPPHTAQPKSRWPTGALASSQGINSRQSRQGAHSDRSRGRPNRLDRDCHR